MIGESILDDMRLILSALWIGVAFSLAFEAILGFLKPGYIKGVLGEEIDGIKITQNVLVGNAVMMMIPSVMFFLSLALPYPMIRWISILFSIGLLGLILMTFAWMFTYKIQYWTYQYLFKFTQSSLYVLIIWYAWNWVI